MHMQMWFLWAVPRATRKATDRILMDHLEHTVLSVSAHIRAKLVVKDFFFFFPIHSNVNLSCGKGEGNKDLGIDGILFTRHCRKLLQILSLQGERYFKLRSL